MTVQLPGQRLTPANDTVRDDDPLSFKPPPAPPEEPAPEPEPGPGIGEQLSEAVANAGKRDYGAELDAIENAPPIQKVRPDVPQAFQGETFQNPDLNSIMGDFTVRSSFGQDQARDLSVETEAAKQGKSVGQFQEDQAAAEKAQVAIEEDRSYLDRALGWLNEWRGPLAPDEDASEIAKSGISQIYRGGKALTDVGLLGGELDKGMMTGYFGMKEMVGGGLKQYGKTLQTWDPDELDMWIGQHLINAGEQGIKEGRSITQNPLLAARVATYDNIKKETWFKDTVDYIASKAGQGIGNMAGIASFYASGGSLGGAGFLTTISIGEVRNELESEGITDEATLQKYGYAAGLVVAALERVFPEGLAKQMKGEIKKKITKGLIKRIVKGGARGALTEGITEGLQEAVQVASTAHAKEAKDLFDIDPLMTAFSKGATWTRIFDAAISGALPGGMFGSYVQGISDQAALQSASQRGARLLQSAEDLKPGEPLVDGDIAAQAEKMDDLRKEAEAAGAIEPTDETAQAPLPTPEADAAVAAQAEAAPAEAQPAEALPAAEVAAVTPPPEELLTAMAEPAPEAPVEQQVAQPAAPAVDFDRTTIASGQKLPEDMTVVDVNPAAVTQSMDPNLPLPANQAELEAQAQGPAGPERDYANQQLQRQQGLRDFQAQGNKVSLPEIYVNERGVGFQNGRNRFTLARDSGMTSVPVAVPKDQVEQMRAAGLLAEAPAAAQAPGPAYLPTAPRERARSISSIDEAQRLAFKKFASQAGIDLNAVDVTIEYTNEKGQQESMRMPAKRAMDHVEQRLRGLAQLVRCLG